MFDHIFWQNYRINIVENRFFTHVKKLNVCGDETCVDGVGWEGNVCVMTSFTVFVTVVKTCVIGLVDEGIVILVCVDGVFPL